MKTLTPAVFLITMMITLFPSVYAISCGSQFINSSCSNTVYSDLCCQSLASYAKLVEKRPASLARIAIRVSLSRTKEFVQQVVNLTKAGNTTRNGTLLYCKSQLGSSRSYIKDSLKQMRNLTAGSMGELLFKLSNVKTWMSAAITYTSDCDDEIKYVRNWPLKSRMGNGTSTLTMLTSNALALVNIVAANCTGP